VPSSRSHDDPAPYDILQPFDAGKLLDGLSEEERVIHVADDPTLGEMASRARQAWAELKAEADEW